MSFPIPPTDNLYKFLAISGLLAILSTQVLFWVTTREYLEKTFETEPKLKALEIESRRLRDDSYELEKEMERTKDSTRLQQLRELDKRNRERSDAHAVSLAELRARSELLQVLKDRVDLVRMLTWGGAILGSGLTVVGFALWWRRVQVHQDRILKRAK